MPIALTVHGWLESELEKPSKISGQELHRAFFRVLKRVDSSVATLLHSQDTKPFTLAPLPVRGNSKNPKEATPFAFRISLLQDEIYQALSRSFLQETPELILENHTFLVSEIRAASGSWVAHSTYDDIFERSQAAQKIGLRFATPTVFKRGDLDYPLPDPRLLFQGWLKKWNLYSPYPFTEELLDRIPQIVGFSHVELRTLPFFAGHDHLIGFVGRVVLCIEGSEEERKLLATLADFAFWAGTGRKTTHGAGLTRRYL